MRSQKEIYNDIYRNSENVLKLSPEELERLKKTLLEIYLDVAEVCRKHGLTCFLDEGTLLGAVRHGGFIPWDDDLDVLMPRPDYEKFKAVFREELGDRYALNAANYSDRPTNRFPKVLKKGTTFVEVNMPEDERACIKIDIFILENVPSNRLHRWIKGALCNGLMFIAANVLGYENRKTICGRAEARYFVGRLFSVIPSAKWFSVLDQACRYRENEQTEFVGIPFGRKHYFGEILRRDVYFPPEKGVFEGYEAVIPRDWDFYLTNLYGDYRQLPPEEKREHHYVTKLRF